jgi:hypothetical protein
MKKLAVCRAALFLLTWSLIPCHAHILDENNKTRQVTATKVFMNNSEPTLKAGMVYPERLAVLFGVPQAQSIAPAPPLLGAALEIKIGNRGGNICRLHVYCDGSLAVPLPSLQQLASAGAKLEQFPFASIKTPTKEIRQAIAEDVRHLAKRAIVRFGSSPPTSVINASQEPSAAYVSVPLEGYYKEFVPGVSWLVMSINCALAVRQDFTYISMFLETPKATPYLILNQIIRPTEMVDFKIPNKLFKDMNQELEQALVEDATASSRGKPASWYKVIY